MLSLICDICGWLSLLLVVPRIGVSVLLLAQENYKPSLAIRSLNDKKDGKKLMLIVNCWRILGHLLIWKIQLVITRMTLRLWSIIAQEQLKMNALSVQCINFFNLDEPARVLALLFECVQGSRFDLEQLRYIFNRYSFSVRFSYPISWIVTKPWFWISFVIIIFAILTSITVVYTVALLSVVCELITWNIYWNKLFF